MTFLDHAHRSNGALRPSVETVAGSRRTGGGTNRHVERTSREKGGTLAPRRLSLPVVPPSDASEACSNGAVRPSLEKVGGTPVTVPASNAHDAPTAEVVVARAAEVAWISREDGATARSARPSVPTIRRPRATVRPFSRPLDLRAPRGVATLRSGRGLVTVRIATVHVESLFQRPKAMNDPTWAVGSVGRAARQGRLRSGS